LSGGVHIPAEKVEALELLTPVTEQVLFAEINYELELCHSITETRKNFDMTLLN
jgi:hypothetical protein